jgi:hypothetical protein
MAVALVDVLSRQCITLEFCKSEGRRIMRCGMNGWCDRRGQRHRERQREAEDLAVDPVRRHPGDCYACSLHKTFLRQDDGVAAGAVSAPI